MVLKELFLSLYSGLLGNPTEKYVTLRLGIWEVVILSQSRLVDQLSNLPSRAALLSYYSYVPYLCRFFKEIYSLAPRQVIGHALESLWSSLESGVALYYTSQLLDLIAERLQGNKENGYEIIRVVLARVVCAILSNLLTTVAQRDKEILQDRIKYHFMLKSMRVVMNLDLITAEDPEVKNKLGDNTSFQYNSDAWGAFECLHQVIFSMTRMVSQLLLAFTLVRGNGAGPTFVVMCMLQPVFMYFLESDSLWTSSYVSYCVEPPYSRMAALHQLAYDEQFRSDRLSDGVGEYIEKEFIKQRSALGDKCTADVFTQYWYRQSLPLRTMTDLSRDLPLFFFALRTIFNIKDMTVTSLTVMQQTSQTIAWTIAHMSYQMKTLSKHLNAVKNLYMTLNLKNKIKDGNAVYPSKEPEIDSHDCGAQIEFREVSFAYPGSTRNALTRVSFTIKPGQMIVIVGVNGSGKSSIIKLFNRLYDPTEGQILLDGLPLSSYKLSDIRRAMAILRQDHTPYPLTLRENISLGLPERDATEAELEAATKQGGAYDFIEKLDKRMETVLQPVKISDAHFPGETIEDLKSLVDGKEKTTDISGGESQRLAASRTFMRLSGGHIRFLAADEPTSALDPEGEFELFTRLKQLRGGKTVVFITHRFGHLTRHADLILCMKDGELVEQGTHNELINKGGEYYKLHNVQAQAFLPN